MHRLPGNGSCANRSMRLHDRIELPHEDLIIYLQVFSLSSTWTSLCLLPHLRKRNAELQSRRSLIFRNILLQWMNNESLGLRCFEQKESSETRFLLYFLDEANGVLLWQKTIRRMFSLPARSTFSAVASYQKELQQTRIELILSKTYHTSAC